MNRLPQKKKPGDPVLASDWNALLDAIAARTPRPGAGLDLVASSGGFAYSAPGATHVPRQSLPPFAVIGIEKVDESFKVIVKEGWVIERRPKTGDTPTVKFHMPKSGDTALDTIPRPKITMALGDTLWCKYRTNDRGDITEAPELIVAAGDQEGTHYQPEDPEGSGQEGTYYVKLFKLEDDAGTPRVKVYQQGDIEHWAQLWTGENVGAGAGVYKRHNTEDNTFEFRRITGNYGLVESEAGETLNLDFEAENIGEEGEEIYKKVEGDYEDIPAQFRKLAGRGYYTGDDPDPGVSEQIKVKTDEPVVRVLGNGKVGQLLYDGSVVLEWNDGLVISPSAAITPPGGFPGGADLDLIIEGFGFNPGAAIQYKDWSGNNQTSGLIPVLIDDTGYIAKLHWRNGLFVGVTTGAGNPPWGEDDDPATGPVLEFTVTYIHTTT